MTFEQDGFVFTLDRAGLKVHDGNPVDFELDYEELDIDPARAALDLGARLTTLLRQMVEDEEGLFDLAVHRDAQLVASLALSCEPDALEVVGERCSAVSEASLAQALLAALPKL